MPNKKTIKIGLDFHGVITDNPDYFQKFANLALQRGYEIHVISGGPQETIIHFLQQWKFGYTNIFAIVDYYDAQGKVIFYENGKFMVDDDLWNHAKAQYCKEHHIDIHIDDSHHYAKVFATPFCHYDTQHHCCILDNGLKINLYDNPSLSLDEIEDLVIS